MNDDSAVKLAAQNVLLEAAELTDGSIGAAPGEHPLVQYASDPPRAPTELEAAFLDAARAFALAGMNSLPQDMLTAITFKIEVHGARVWIDVDSVAVALVLELRGERAQIASLERATLH
jgi:hypothetical protein